MYHLITSQDQNCLLKLWQKYLLEDALRLQRVSLIIVLHLKMVSMK